MRVLLDESVPRQLVDHLVGHDVTTVPTIGWAGFRNGELMAKAATQFDAFVTADNGIEFQQNYSELDLGIVVLRGRDNRVETIVGMAGAVLESLSNLQPGQLVRVAG